jgi:hypothetical protein
MGYFNASFLIQADPLNLGAFFAGNFNIVRRPQYIHGERVFRPAIFIVANDCNGFIFFIHCYSFSFLLNMNKRPAYCLNRNAKRKVGAG